MFSKLVGLWSKDRAMKVATFAFAVAVASLSVTAGLRVIATAIALDVLQLS